MRALKVFVYQLTLFSARQIYLVLFEKLQKPDKEQTVIRNVKFIRGGSQLRLTHGSPRKIYTAVLCRSILQLNTYNHTF